MSESKTKQFVSTFLPQRASHESKKVISYSLSDHLKIVTAFHKSQIHQGNNFSL